MKSKKIIKEQQEQGQNNPSNLLDLAVMYNCFPENQYGAFTKRRDVVTNKLCLYKKSTNPTLVDAKKNYVFIFPNDDGYTFSMEYRDNPEQEGKVIEKNPSVSCKSITKTGALLASPDQQKVIDYLKQEKFIQIDQLPKEKWNQYSLVDLSQDPDSVKLLQDKGLYNTLLISIKDKQPLQMWKPKGLSAATEDIFEQGNKLVSHLSKLGWISKDKMSPEIAGDYIGIDLSNKDEYVKNDVLKNLGDYSKYFKQGYVMYQPIKVMSMQELLSQKQTTAKRLKTEYNKNDCVKLIKLYWESMEKDLPIGQGEKSMVEMCVKSYQYPYMKGKIDAIKYTTREKKKYQLFTNQDSKERDKVLQQTISEGLQKLKKQKKINETLVIKKKLTILSEGKNLRNKKELNSFFDKFLVETAILNSKGYDSKLISEGFFDFIGSFFGTGVESVMSYFKEYAAKWLLSIAGIDSKGWIGSIITTALGNLKFGDIPKITSCEFLVPYLAKTISESAAKKYMESQTSESPIGSIMRNAVFEVLEDSAFGQAIEKGLEGLICPKLGHLQTKMGNVKDQLITKAETSGEQMKSAPSLASQL